MKRISLFLSCLFAAMSVFAGSLSGTLIGTATEYQFDYDFTVDIASKQVTMEGVLNHEAFVVDGMAIDVMLAGKIVGQAAMSNDTVSYTFADKYNRGDKLQLALKFNYTAGMTMSKPFAYEVAPVTHLYAKVPASSPNCYIRNSSPFNSDYYPMTLVEEGEDSTVYEYYFEDNYYHQTVILAWNFDYDDKYCSCVSNGNIFNFYIDSQDKVCDLKEAAGGWRKTFMLQVEGKEVAAELYKPMYWEPIFIANAPVQLYAGDIFSITSTYDGTPLTITAPAGAPYTVLEDNLIVQNADGLYTLAMDTTGGKNVLTMERAKNKNYYVLPGASYVGVGLDGKAFAGWNTAADISDHVLTINAGTESTDGNANGGIKFAAGNYLKLIAAAKYYVLAFDYKSNIDGVAEVQIVRAKGNPAEGDVVYAQTLPTADDWKQFVVELDKMEPIEAEDDDFLYIMVNMSGCQWKGGDAVDMREIRFVPYTKYEVTVPAETEVCRVKGTNAEFDADMTRVSDNVFSVAFIGNDYHATTYNYYSGPSAENIEVAADEKDAEPRWWAAADEVVAWKEAYCIPKYGYLMNDQLTQFAEVEYGSYLLENVKIAEEDSAYYIINICTEDTMKAAEVPAVAGEYKIELALADTSVVFTKTDTIAPDEKEYLCNMIWSGDVAISWDPSVAMNALAWGGYDWTTAKSGDKLTVYFAKTEGAAYTNLRFGNGFWAALPTTLADPTSAEDGTYGGLDEKTSMSIILSQADINVLVNEGGLVICGNGLNIKGVELCREADIECNVIWSGETALGNWEASVGDLSWGGYDWTTVKQGVKLTVRYEVDAAIGYTNLRFGNGSWNALPSTLADPATDKDGNYSGFAADATSKAVILSDADLNELVNNGGLVICGAGLVIKGIELCNPRQDGPAEVCFDIIDEAFNALDENASITDSVMTFAAANSAMNMWVEDYDLSLTNTLTIEYEATTDFQVLLQDEQGEEQLVADADTNIIVYHYLAAVDMANLLQLIFVAQEAGTVKINSICFSQVEYPTYYLGNKWDGAEEVSFREMSTDNYGVWTLTGVLGSDEVLLAFEAEPKESVAYKISEITEISGKELLVGDEVKFYCYEYIVNAIEAEVLVRPTYVKHPWESGEWTWAMMTRNEDLHQWEYVGIWGGQGFNINAAGPYDNGALWFAANSADVTYISPEGEEMPEPAVGTEVTICYQDNDTKAGVRYEIPTGLNSIKANVKAIKVMENGQMFIIRDNKVYNIVGACVRNK